MDADISDSHDTECSNSPFDTIYDNSSFHVELESNTSRLYGSTESLIDADYLDSHDTECSKSPFDTIYDNSSFHVELESNTSRLYGSCNSLIDVGKTDSHDTECSQPPIDILFDNTSFHVESESNTAGLYGSTKSLIDIGIRDSHDTECSHPQFDRLHDNASFHMETESNTSRLYGSTKSLLDIDILDSYESERSNPEFDTRVDSATFHMESESNTKTDNKHDSQTARFHKRSLNTNHTENSTTEYSLVTCNEINKDITGEIVSQETNDVTVVPGDAVFKKSKQSINNCFESSDRSVVENQEYDGNTVIISSGSDILNNNKRNLDPNTNGDVSEKLTRTHSCLDDPPDGGWSWAVTFSAFMVGVVVDGISFSFGLFFKELYVYFNESKSLTSWIISVLNGTYLGIGKSVKLFVLPIQL